MSQSCWDAWPQCVCVRELGIILSSALFSFSRGGEGFGLCTAGYPNPSQRPWENLTHECPWLQKQLTLTSVRLSGLAWPTFPSPGLSDPGSHHSAQLVGCTKSTYKLMFSLSREDGACLAATMLLLLES